MRTQAGVAELVDATDSKSVARIGREGSSPSSGIHKRQMLNRAAPVTLPSHGNFSTPPALPRLPPSPFLPLAHAGG